MCGIAGIVDFYKAIGEKDLSRLRLAVDAFKYRGPDKQDAVIYQNKCAFGHARLSIIDINTRSDQPMYIPRILKAIVFNGEIYNYKEIRSELAGLGETFETNSDTEVLLLGYHRFGKNILDKMIGMFAFAIYDLKNSEVFFARDRFGEKPFFYSLENNRFSFASNLTSIKKLINNYTINPQAISELFSYQYISENYSIFSNVNKLPAGYYGFYNNKGINVQKYWDIDYRKKIDVSFDEAKDKVEQLLHESIKLQLNADVPVGVFLSGGVDSGTISAIASRYKPNVQSITMTVPNDPNFNEYEYAKRIALKNSINSVFVEGTSNHKDVLYSLFKMIEPFGDSSVIPTYIVSQTTSKYLKVALTGDGGDEIFGGYGKPLMSLRSTKRNNFLIRYLIKHFGDRRFNPLYTKLGNYSISESGLDYLGFDDYIGQQDYLSGYIKDKLFKKSFGNKINLDRAQSLKKYIDWDKFDTIHDGLLYIGVKTRLVNDYLMKVDTSSMGASIETRSPFFDHRLIEFTSKLKPEVLMPYQQEKAIIRKIAEKYIDKDIIYAKKKGFSLPVREYLLGDWGNDMQSLLKSGRSEDLGIFEKKGLQKLIEWHSQKSNPELTRLLFSIYAFEIWLKVFFTE